MIQDYQLCAEDIRQVSMTTLKRHLSLNLSGYRCDTDMVFNVLLKAAADNGSVEAACADLDEVASSNTIREQLNTALDVAQLRQHEIELNAALASAIPPELPQGNLEIAMDFHDEPFYGKTPELRTYVCRGKAKQGTTHFFRIATAYVIWRDVRITLAVTYVLPEHNVLAVLEQLHQRVAHLGFQATVLYLDKGFCSGEVIRYLQDHQQKTVMACPIRGKTGGTRALCRGRKSYRTVYTFTDGTTADVVAVATLPPGANGRRRRKWLLFVVIDLDWKPNKVKNRYRKRFGIECSYRQMRRVRIVTNALNPALRFFVLGFSLCLVNVWIKLRWIFARKPGRGIRRVDPTKFRFHRFIHFLMRAVESAYGVVMAIPSRASPQSVIY